MTTKEDIEALNARLNNLEKLLNTFIKEKEELTRAFNVHAHNMVFTQPSFSPEAAKFVQTGVIPDANRQPEQK